MNQQISLALEVPIRSIKDSLISLWYIPDSVEVPRPFTTGLDDKLPTRGWIRSEWESASSYRLQILPGAVELVYPLEHDTIDVGFNTRDLEYYGRILLNLEGVEQAVIVQLRKRDDIFSQQIALVPGLYEFPFLTPGDYTLKFIHDLNGNGKWDTGNYLEKRQPEPVEFYPNSVTVRSNWDHEVNMVLEK
jgi:hypothetical protein